MDSDYHCKSCNCPLETPMCSEKGTCRTCDEGFYGSECKQVCPTCPENANCNSTGACVCNDGWIGSKCEKKCLSNNYGKDCKRVCFCIKGTCHHVKGICTCHFGWTGDKCDIKQEHADEILRNCRQGLQNESAVGKFESQNNRPMNWTAIYILIFAGFSVILLIVVVLLTKFDITVKGTNRLNQNENISIQKLSLANIPLESAHCLGENFYQEANNEIFLMPEYQVSFNQLKVRESEIYSVVN